PPCTRPRVERCPPPLPAPRPCPRLPCGAGPHRPRRGGRPSGAAVLRRWRRGPSACSVGANTRIRERPQSPLLPLPQPRHSSSVRLLERQSRLGVGVEADPNHTCGVIHDHDPAKPPPVRRAPPVASLRAAPPNPLRVVIPQNCHRSVPLHVH